MFSLPPPSHLFGWSNIILLLLYARHHTSSPASRQILLDVVNQQIPTWIRKHKSVCLGILYDIGYATYDRAWRSWEHAIELFTHLDKIMVEMCSESYSAEGLDEEGVERWRRLRTDFLENTMYMAPIHLRLPVGYFDTLRGHGPI